MKKLNENESSEWTTRTTNRVLHFLCVFAGHEIIWGHAEENGHQLGFCATCGDRFFRNGEGRVTLLKKP